MHGTAPSSDCIAVTVKHCDRLIYLREGKLAARQKLRAAERQLFRSHLGTRRATSRYDVLKALHEAFGENTLELTQARAQRFYVVGVDDLRNASPSSPQQRFSCSVLRRSAAVVREHQAAGARHFRRGHARSVRLPRGMHIAAPINRLRSSETILAEPIHYLAGASGWANFVLAIDGGADDDEPGFVDWPLEPADDRHGQFDALRT